MNTIDPKRILTLRHDGRVGYYGGSQLILSQTSDDLDTAIEITTTEGDKVTLTSVVQHNAMVSEDRTKLLDKNSLWVSVKGALSEQEIAEINQVLDRIDNAIKNLISGKIDSDDISQLISSIALETIKGVDGQVESKPGQVGGKPSTEKSVQEFREIARKLWNEHFDRLGDTLVDMLRSSKVDPAAAASPVNKLFGKIVTEARKEGGLDRKSLSLVGHIHSQFIAKLMHLSNNAGKESNPASGYAKNFKSKIIDAIQ